jgi:uncharacterized protein with FMN-binding domain
MKKFFKWMGIILLVMIAMMIYAFLGMKHTVNLDIQTIDLIQIPDGTYTGSYDCYRWSNKVEVTVKEHRITNIQALKIQDGRGSLVKALTQKVLNQQSPDVDVISGATASSNGYLRAVEMALKSAMVKP